MIKKFLLLYLLTFIVNAQPLNEKINISDSCVNCHKEEVEAWKGSDHERAMDHATNESILGDFSNKTVKFEKRTGKFYIKNGLFFVDIIEKEKKDTVKISYTFGHDPLQQYMVEFPDGRVQLIPFTWDSRPKEKGGQRWYDLYPDTTEKDEFYWKNTGQNWNFMCADCHSTNLEKNYDKKTNTYNTKWTEINVGCEACHGSPDKHLELTKSKTESKFVHYGFERDLSQSVKEWSFNKETGNMIPKEIKETDQVTVCAQCHSRRLQISEEGDHLSGDLFDKYIVSNITDELYHTDGQVYDENYVYGSFIKSEMAKKGVTCTNCHDPHKAELKIEKKYVCTQCHSPETYSAEKHTFHKEGKGSECVDCHMPETTYMEVDDRSDHSWHIPNPKENALSNSVNVCTNCHTDKDLRWADEQLNLWFPNSSKREITKNNVAIAFNDYRQRKPNIDDKLAHIAQNKNNTYIIKASALERLADYPSQNAVVSLYRNVKSENSQVRHSVVLGAQNLTTPLKWKILTPLLTDKVLAVRTEAASKLARDWQQLNPEQKRILESPLNEYIKIQEFNSDRGFGRANIANINAYKGDFENAIKEYKGAIEIEPYFVSSYLNLAGLYQNLGNETELRRVLGKGIVSNPDSDAIYHSLAMSYYRGKEVDKAVEYLNKALLINKNNSQYWYVYGLMIEKTDIENSLLAIDNAFRLTNNPQYLYSKCEISLRNKKDTKICLEELKHLISENILNGLISKY